MHTGAPLDTFRGDVDKHDGGGSGANSLNEAAVSTAP